MKNWKKWLITGLASAGIATTSMITESESEKLQNYVENDLEQIVKSQEETFNIDLQPPPITVSHKELNLNGKYEDEDRERITLYAPSILSDTSRGKFTEKEKRQTRIVLRHELAHAYADRRSEELKNVSWPKSYFPSITTSTVAMISLSNMKIWPKDIWKEIELDYMTVNMISEGIATYMQKDGGSSREHLDLSQGLDELNSFKLRYHTGYEIVEPILDKYGREGLDYLVTHPPQVNSLEDMWRYQKDVLTALQERHDDLPGW